MVERCALELYLVRHGLTQWNMKKKYLGHTDIALDQACQFQLSAMKEWLNHQSSIDYVYASDLKRCIQTATYLCAGKRICIDPRLREINFGQWEGKTYEQLKSCSHYKRWLSDWENQRPPKGEKGTEFVHRVNDMTDEWLQNMATQAVRSLPEGKRDRIPQDVTTSIRCLFVTHGGVIRALMHRFAASASFWHWKADHGKGYNLRFKYEGEKWKCISWSVVPTLEKEK